MLRSQRVFRGRRRSPAHLFHPALPVVLLALMFLPPRPALAQGIVVTDLTDRALNDPNSDNGSCSLREAIESANFDNNTNPPVDDCQKGSGADFITFSTSGTINLIDQLQINTAITITGPVVINGANTGGDAPFRITSNGVLSLATMVIKDSVSGGGAAILNESGKINILAVSFQNNKANTGGGGAINSNGDVNILASNFSGNTALGSGSGGAIAMSGTGTLKIAASGFSGNTSNNNGGAINLSGQATMELTDSAFSGNIANREGDPDDDGIFDTDAGGGAIFTDANTTMSVTRVAFSGNLSPNGSGGALFLKSITTIEDSSFNGNIAGDLDSNGRGGAIYNDRNTSAPFNLTISGATFNGNLAPIQGNGGGLLNNKGNVRIANSSFFANVAGGSGGAIYNTDSNNLGSEATVTLINVTLSDNALPSNGTPALFNKNGERVNLQNTIIANDVGAANCSGTMSDQGHNLQFPGNDCGGGITVANPNLELPFFNGGPLPTLLTQALGDNSAAIDQGDNSICAADPVNNEDQRGKSRPKDGDGVNGAACDIGAFEADTAKAGYGSTPVQPGPIAFGNAVIGTPLNASLTIFETGNLALDVSLTGINGVNVADFSVQGGDLPLTIANGGGPATVDLTCTPSAAGARLATLVLQTNDPDHTSVSYDLVCNGTPVPVAGYGSTPIKPGPIDFGEVVVSTTANAGFTLQETGNATLNVQNPVLGGVNPGDFNLTTALPININDGGAAQPVQLTCTPTAAGIRTATLTLTSNDPTQSSVAYNLACFGFIPPPPYLETPGQSVNNASPVGSHGPFGIAVSPDSKHVYVTDNGDALMTVFSRNLTTGALTLLETQRNGVNGVSGLAGGRLLTVSPDGRSVYIAAAFEDSVTNFSRNTDTGTLTFWDSVTQGDGYNCTFLPPSCAGNLTGLSDPFGVAVSPDGRHVYVTGALDDAVVVLRRDVADGSLTQTIFGVNFIQTYASSANINEPQGLAFSPDGASLYVAGHSSDTVAVFSRNGSDGKLTFVEKFTDGQGGVDGLDGATQIAVSPDGAFIYAASDVDSTIVVFQRNAINGQLTYLTRYKDGENGLNDLAGASGVAISPDGTYLYATSYNDKALVVFSRSLATGLLTLNQTIKRNPFSGAGGVPGLDGARDVAASPDGRSVHATGFNDDKVVTLGVANPTPRIESLNPASIGQGSGGFTLTVNGDNFVEGAEVRWNGSARPTVFITAAELQANISAGDVGSAGQVDITVFNPAPGGGLSNIVKFTITPPNDNPVPSLTALLPAGAQAGDPALTVTLQGSGFVPGVQGQWNGVARPTSYISSETAQMDLTTADLAAPGPAGITVVNPGPGGGVSNALLFEVAAPGENPVPTLSGLTPASIIAAGATSSDLELVVTGLNFIPDSTVYWNGEARPTTFIDETELQALITAADLAAGDTAGVTVVNPGPGGGESNSLTFTIAQPGENLIPSITGISLTYATQGSGFDLIVTGTNFISGSVVRWNGTDRPTTVNGATQATIRLSANDLRAAGASVTVFNPPPGGGESNPALLAIRTIYLPGILN